MKSTLNAPGIYAITHIESGRRYVGSAVNIRKRWNRHKEALNMGKHTNLHLQRAWQKYGHAAFEFTVIEHCPVEQLLGFEQSEINKQSEFNILPTAGSRLGHEVTLETRAKLSAANKGKINHAWLGRKHTIESRAKMSTATRGRVFTEETRAKISAAGIGNTNARNK